MAAVRVQILEWEQVDDNSIIRHATKMEIRWFSSFKTKTTTFVTGMSTEIHRYLD
jgi:hypothetical protein